MKKVLVLVQNYPDNSGGISLMYVHVRNKYYVKHGISVTVLSFTAKNDYNIDNIRVITEKTYKNENKRYDIAILHAANIKNHYRFLNKYEKEFRRLIFFFHGHEVLKINETYSKAFFYIKNRSLLKRIFQNIYDTLKLSIWHYYLSKVAYKSDYVFVSNTFYKEFKKYVGLSKKELMNHVHIINNSVGEIFEEKTYNFDKKKIYDFITIRNDIDSSTYGIDLVYRLAKRNPNKKFLLIGKGKMFEYLKKPDNITWIKEYLKHEEMLKYIDSSRCALMPTRRDTQGVMSCELITYGIPLITSELPICFEMFGNLSNVLFISDNVDKVNLQEVYEKITKLKSCEKISLFSYDNTVRRKSYFK